MLLSVTAAMTAFFGGLYLAKYKTTALILVKPREAVQAGVQMQTGLVGQSTLGVLEQRGITYVKVLKSRPVAEQVVKRLQLDKQSTPGTSSSGGTVSLQQRVKKVLQKIVFGAPPAIQYNEFERATQKVQRSVSASLLAKTTVIGIEVSHDDPTLTRDIANTTAEVFVEFSREINAREATTTRKFLEENVKNTQKELETAQQELQAFKQETGVMVDLPAEISQRFRELATLETDMKQVTANIESSKNRIEKFAQELPKQSKYVQASSTIDRNPLIQSLKQSLIQLESQLPVLLTDFTSDHPQVIALKEQIATIKSALNKEVKRELTMQISQLNPVHENIVTNLINEEATLQASQARRDALQSVISNFSKELQLASDQQSEWDHLISNVNFYTTSLNDLQTQLEAARLTEAQKLSEISLLEKAGMPRYPKVKGLPLLAFPCIGFLFGLMAGICLVILYDYFDDTVKSAETIEKALKLPVYGTILDMTNGQKRRRSVSEKGLLPMQKQLLTHVDPVSPILEQFRHIGVSIQFLPTSQNTSIRCLLVSSALPKEGKTVTVCNLAITLAQLDKRVLIIDGDLRNPMIHKMFQVPQEGGLTDFLSNTSTNSFKTKPSGIHSLMLITSGTSVPNSAKLLTSKRLSKLLQALKTKYDFILLDTPPIAVVADGLILAALPEVDGILLTVKAGSTSVSTCLHAKSLLENVNGKVLGTVLNGIKRNERSNYYGKY